MKSLALLIIFLIGEVVAIKEPEFIVESKTSEYEIRKYPEIVVAETEVDADFETSRNQAFRILAGYLFGDNKSKTKNAMTAPVNQLAVSEKIQKARSSCLFGIMVGGTIC